MTAGFKNQVVDIAMNDGTKMPLKCRVYGGRAATHKPINNDKSSTQIVTDVPSGSMVAAFDKAAKAATFATWLAEFMGSMSYKDLTDEQVIEIREKVRDG